MSTPEGLAPSDLKSLCDFLYRRTVARGEAAPSRQVLAGIAAGLLVFGAALSWFGVHQRLPPDARYVPARIEDGRIVPGHAGPR